MPIYEFYCQENNTLYQFLARNLAYQGRVPICPDNPVFKLEKRVSQFAVIGRAKEETENDPFAGIDDIQMESLMADMEGDMSSLDSENPDPRQLGHFMRKMTDLMGSKTPPELREMVRRLEAGEDPEKLESELGGMDDEGAADTIFSQVKKMMRTGRPAIRDPKLYEFREWLGD